MNIRKLLCIFSERCNIYLINTPSCVLNAKGITVGSIYLFLLFLDIDECSNNGGPCQNGKCINMAGSYRCECQDGFNLGLDGRTCLGM